MRRAAATGILLGLIAMSVAADGQQRDTQSSPERANNRKEAKPLFMFVQTASSGAFTPIPDKPGHFRLALRGVSPQTIFFSDRPERITGQVPTDKFLQNLGFSQQNPPNAAVSLLEAAEKNDVVIVELSSPSYDAIQGTLSYEVAVLKSKGQGDTSKGLGPLAEKADESLPLSFSNASLFIDDCSDGVLCVSRSDCEEVGSLQNAGTCWSWEGLRCEACSPGPDSDLCNQQFSECNGNCAALDMTTFTQLCHWPKSLP